jgi:formate dehydrogenase major subunit
MSTSTWRDLGTPESASENFVDLMVDGVSVSVPEGTSILRAASEAGLSIPKLCATESLGGLRVVSIVLSGSRGASRVPSFLYDPS